MLLEIKRSIRRGIYLFLIHSGHFSLEIPSEIVNKRIPLFTIQQRYKYYFSCCIFLYMCVFFLRSADLSYCISFRTRFFLMRLYTYAFFPMCLFFFGHPMKDRMHCHRAKMSYWRELVEHCRSMYL